MAYHNRSNWRFWIAPLHGLTSLGAWILQHALLSPTQARIRTRIAQLSKEMGLRSAEVIAFPQARRRQPSPLLKLSQRAAGKARQARLRRDARPTPRVDRG